MHIFTPILAAADELVYVIAVLILSIAGALFEKFKGKAESGKEERPGADSRAPGDSSLPRPWIGETPPPDLEAERAPAKPRPERIPPPVPGRRSVPQPPPVARPGKSAGSRPPVARVPQSERPRRAEVTPPPRKPLRERPLAPAAELIFEAMRVARPPEIASPQAVQRAQEIRPITAPAQQISAYPTKSFHQMNAAEWRRAIILSEVLAPPLALRQDHGPENGPWM